MNLRKTCGCYGPLIKLTEHIIKFAFEVILVNDPDLFERYLRALILENLEYLYILFWGYPFQSADILPSFEVDAATALTQV